MTETPYLWRIKAGKHTTSATSTTAAVQPSPDDDFDDDDGVLNVPENMEVILLKPGDEATGGVGALLGKAPYACLLDVLTRRKMLRLGDWFTGRIADSTTETPFSWLGMHTADMHFPFFSHFPSPPEMCKSFVSAMSRTAFDLGRFLRDEAMIDSEEEYLLLLHKNKVDEEALRELATQSEEAIEARLEKWGISALMDRVQLARAISRRFGGLGGSR